MQVRQDFIEHLELKGFTDRTIDNYVKCVYKCAEYHNRPPQDLSHEDIKQFLLHLKNEKRLAPKTINLYFYSLKSFYNYFLFSEEVMRGFSRMKEPVKKPEVLSKGEIETLVNAAPSLKVKALLALLYSSGIRLTECSNVKISDIDGKRKVLRIEQGKGKIDRYAVLSERALILLRDYCRQYRPKIWLFENKNHTRQLCRRQIQHYVVNSGRAAGIAKKVTPHILRHSFAAHLVEARHPLQAIQQFLGHASIRTTTQYTHISTELLNSIGSPFDDQEKKEGVSNA